jgi:hypothetical protein
MPMAQTSNRRLGRRTLHAIPAGLAAVALLALACWPAREGLAPGSALRDCLAHVLALGACSEMLALGLGVWIAVRLRTLTSLLLAAAAVALAVAWWQVVFAPLLAP